MSAQSAGDVLTVEDLDHVKIVTLNRPTALNAMNSAMRKHLLTVIDDLSGDSTTRVLVLLAQGESFSVGHDVKEPQPERTLAEAVREELVERFHERLSELGIVTIVGMQGYALGRGLMLGMACDIRIAAEDLSAGLPEVRIGMLPALGGTHMLSQLVGMGRAAQMILTGERIDAQTALAWGLVTDVVPRAELRERVLALAADVASCAPVGQRLAKMALADSAGSRFHDAFVLETLLVAVAQSTSDWQEGIAAIRARRTPEFRGR